MTSKIDIPNTENDVEIIWRIVDKKDELRLADLVVEGVSMLMSYRNEYTSVLQQNGGDVGALVKQLAAKNETLKNRPENNRRKNDKGLTSSCFFARLRTLFPRMRTVRRPAAPEIPGADYRDNNNKLCGVH